VSRQAVQVFWGWHMAILPVHRLGPVPDFKPNPLFSFCPIFSYPGIIIGRHMALEYKFSSSGIIQSGGCDYWVINQPIGLAGRRNLALASFIVG